MMLRIISKSRNPSIKYNLSKSISSNVNSFLSKKKFTDSFNSPYQYPNNNSILRYCCLFSTVPEYAVTDSIDKLNGEAIVSDIIYQIDYEDFSISDYNSKFNSNLSSNKPITSLNEGEYINLSSSDIEHYFPEGLAGDSKEEFQHSGHQSWMVRESSKLLCQIIDDFKNKSNPIKDSNNLNSSEGFRIRIDGLTDKPEWSNCILNVKTSGKTMTTGASDEESSLSFSEKVLDNLKKSHPNGIPNKILVTGDRGCGKSIVLNQLVLHARSSGWLCVFVPSGWDQVQSGFYVEPSLVKESVFDNPFMSVSVLRGLFRAHREVLNTLPVTDETLFDKYQPLLSEFRENWMRALSVSGRDKLNFIKMREILEADDHHKPSDELDQDILDSFKFLEFSPKSLLDLVVLGVAFRDVSGSVFTDLMQELRKVTSVPVLVAVDQYNSWEAKSAFAYENVDIQGKDICVPHSLRFISKKKAETNDWTLANGICIAVTSFKHTEGKKVNYDDVQNALPMVLKVPAYNQKEFLSAVCFYSNQTIVSNDIPLNELLAFRMLTASNPRQTRRELVPFFFSKHVARNSGSLTFSSSDSSVSEDENNSFEAGGYETAKTEVGETASTLVDSFIDKKSDNNKNSNKNKKSQKK